MLNLRVFYNSIHQRNIEERFFDRSILKRAHLTLSAFRRHLRKRYVTILDLGPGFGHITRRIGKKYNVIALELSTVAIKVARKNCKNSNVKFVQANIEDGIPFKNGVFDGIFCGEIIEHIANTPTLFSEANRVLKENGILIITTPNYSSLSYKIPFQQNRIS